MLAVAHRAHKRNGYSDRTTTNAEAPAPLPILERPALAGVFVGRGKPQNLFVIFLGVQKLLRLLRRHFPGCHHRGFAFGFLR